MNESTVPSCSASSEPMASNDDRLVRRRRRRIVRPVRDKTPDPASRGERIYRPSDDEDDREVAVPSSGGNVAAEQSSEDVTAGRAARIDSLLGAKTTHRHKILSMRDRAVGPSKAIRSLSSPRVVDAPTDDGQTANECAMVAALPVPVKRSLSSQRHPEELLQRHFARDNRAPARDIDAPEADGERQLSKLERNLLRFEEERRRFDEEKVRFEQEKRDAETALRNRRLQLFERKRIERQHAEAVDNDVHQKLCSILRVIEDSDRYRLPAIATQPPGLAVRRSASGAAAIGGGPAWRMSSGEYTSSLSMTPSPPVAQQHRIVAPIEVLDFPNDSASATGGELGDDYESSTAKSSSSREGDFDDELLFDDDCVTLVPDEIAADGFDDPIDAANAPESGPHSDVPAVAQRRSWLARIFGRKTPAVKKVQPLAPSTGPVSVRRFVFVETRLVWLQLLSDHDAEWQAARRCRNRCLADLVILMIVCGVGGLTFRFVEGAFENFYKCGVRRVKRDFVDQLWTNSHNLREDDWKTLARARLRAFEEELHAAHEAGMTSYSGMKAWTFVNGLIYCLTIITTIGYGHIYPSTNTGRAITIVYSIIGIPLFMILLNDFGKYFTWRIKFTVAFARRLANTSSMGRIYRLAYVQKAVRSINKLYSFLIFKRNRALIPPDPNFKGSALDLVEGDSAAAAAPATVVAIFKDSPIDDEFDLPVAVALVVLVAYLLGGALVFACLENWSVFEAIYFAFVSMSTIGLGDYVPSYPIYVLGSIGYLVFGLALTAMCLNVVQSRLDGGIQRVCARIGATIGLDIGERCAASNPVAAQPKPNARNVRKLKNRSSGRKKTQ